MSDVTKIPGTDDAIVMTDIFERDVTGVEANRFRVDGDATVIWRASPPGTPPDFWTEYLIDGDAVEAFSWSYFRVQPRHSDWDRAEPHVHQVAQICRRRAAVTHSIA